jgi:hypothetical protein
MAKLLGVFARAAYAGQAEFVVLLVADIGG